MDYMFMGGIPYMLWDKMHEDLRSKNHFGSNSEVGRAAKETMNVIYVTIIYEKHADGNYHGIPIFLSDEVWWIMRDGENE